MVEMVRRSVESTFLKIHKDIGDLKVMEFDNIMVWFHNYKIAGEKDMVVYHFIFNDVEIFRLGLAKFDDLPLILEMNETLSKLGE